MKGCLTFLCNLTLVLLLTLLPQYGLNAFTIAPVQINKRGSSQQSSGTTMPNLDPQLGFADCVKYMGYRPVGSDRFAMRFFNSCADRVNINVCVLKDDGSSKLYRSLKRVPVAGNMEIYTLPGDAPPRSVQMAYGSSIPAVPPPCNPNQKPG